MWNSVQSIWGPDTPRASTLRIPTSQSPMPAFCILGRRETSLNAIESLPWPPTSRSPLPTFRFLERPETISIQSIWGHGTLRAPIPRIPTFQSPKDAFLFLRRPENPPISPNAIESPRWRAPWPSTHWSPVPTTFSLLERPETPGHFSANIERQTRNPFGLTQLLHHILDLDSKAPSRTIESLHNPSTPGFQTKPLIHQANTLVMHDPTYNKSETISKVVDDTWNNRNIWPVGPSLKAHEDHIPMGIRRRHQSEEIPRLWGLWDPQRHTDQPAVEVPAYSDSFSDVILAETSPLPLSLPLPFSEDRELWVKFGGDAGYLGWNTLKPSVEKFISQDRRGDDYSLAVTWSPSSSEVDVNGWRGGRTLKLLFDRLKEPATTTDPSRTVLTIFKTISINVPERFEETDIVPMTRPTCTPEVRTAIEADRIDLRSASNLEELLLQGSHLYFAEKLMPLPDHLTLLSITRCQISVNDTLALLQTCPTLRSVHLETVHDKEHCELGDRLSLKPGVKFTSTLRKLTITSSADVSSILEVLSWGDDPEITLNVLDDGAARQILRFLSRTSTGASHIPQKSRLILNGNFIERNKEPVQRNFPNTVFHP